MSKSTVSRDLTRLETSIGATLFRRKHRRISLTDTGALFFQYAFYPEHEPVRARQAFDSHLARAKWMTEHGYRHLLRGGVSGLN